MPGITPGIRSVTNVEREAGGSADQRFQRRVALDHVPPLDQPNRTPDVSGALGDQIAKDACVHDVVVDQLLTFSIYGKSLCAVQYSSISIMERRADAHQQSGDERQPDQ